VVAVPGDLTQLGLGLSAADEKMLQREVTIILHSAASIELAAEIQRTLRWVGTSPRVGVATTCRLEGCARYQCEGPVAFTLRYCYAAGFDT
jgi:hypothetical protein